MTSILQVNHLHVRLKTYAQKIQAVRDVSFTINAGEIVGLVGESGCGKSVMAQSILRLIPSPPLDFLSGSILIEGEEVLKKSEKEMQKIRGKKVGMVFQDSFMALNPTIRIGEQLMEAYLQHYECPFAKEKALELLEQVGIPQPEIRFSQYPFEFSGGMRQRVGIAMAIACDPLLLIADEPTTALDVTVQAQILRLLHSLQQKKQMSVLLITHDLGIVAGICDRILVMYGGKIVESGKVEDVLKNPQHPYTKVLLNAVPGLDRGKEQPLEPILGSPPDLSQPTPGCIFHPRCPAAMAVCSRFEPASFDLENGRKASCWLHHPFAKGPSSYTQGA